MIDLKKLVLEASQDLEATGDKKAWAREVEMRALIAAGAEVVRNCKQIDGTHLTEVIFENIHFTHAGQYPLIPPFVSNVQ